eukprot:s1_g1632.t1
MRPRRHPLINQIVVPEGPDVADDWIAERVTANDIAVTADIPLASRCLEKGASVVGPTGKVFSEDNIGMALGMRELKQHLRESTNTQTYNAGFTARDRSQFLNPILTARIELSSFPSDGVAVVVGGTGGIGKAFVDSLESRDCFTDVVVLGRSTEPALNLLDEDTIAAAAGIVSSGNMPVRLVIDATGLLHNENLKPEKSLAQLDGDQLAQLFAVNATGPALLLKHFLPILPREGKSVFATLSAKVGSIGDNQLGGWHGYRASKAALNQFVRTAAIELKRRKPEAICVALHPGTVATKLSDPFTNKRANVQTPEESASNLLTVVDGLSPEQSGGFFAYDGMALPW